MKISRKLMAVTAVAGSLGLAAMGGPAKAADETSFAVPGTPPVWGGVVGYVGTDHGIFGKYDLDVKMRAFPSGGRAAISVLQRQTDVALAPSQFVVRIMSNRNAPFKAIWGMERPDWLIASMDPNKTACDDFKGQEVGVDSPTGARAIQLRTFLARECKIRKPGVVKTRSVSSNVFQHMASGSLNFGVLHIDDLFIIERLSGTKPTVVARIADVAPGVHYLMAIVRKDNLAQNRDKFVRLVAGLADTVEFMKDPANMDKVAESGKVTKRAPADARRALNEYNEMEFWPYKHHGLSEWHIGNAIKNQVAVGKRTDGRAGIKPDKKAVGYNDIVDLSIWRDAQKIRK